MGKLLKLDNMLIEKSHNGKDARVWILDGKYAELDQDEIQRIINFLYPTIVR